MSPAQENQSVEMESLIQRFQPGLYQAVTAGDFSEVCRLLRYWVSVTSNTMEGKSLIDLTREKTKQGVYVARCLQKLCDVKHQNVSLLSDSYQCQGMQVP